VPHAPYLRVGLLTWLHFVVAELGANLAVEYRPPSGLEDRRSKYRWRPCRLFWSWRFWRYCNYATECAKAANGQTL